MVTEAVCVCGETLLCLVYILLIGLWFGVFTGGLSSINFWLYFVLH